MRVGVLLNNTQLPISVVYGETDGKRVDGMYVRVHREDGITQLYNAAAVHPEEHVDAAVKVHTDYLKAKDELYRSYFKAVTDLPHL